MVSILLSTYDFNNDKCFSKLQRFIKPNMRVCIVPYSHDDDVYLDEDKFNFIYDYDDPGSDFSIIADAYRDYGIEKDRVRVINPIKDNLAMIKNKIQTSDILFFTGGNPAKAMTRMFPILDLLKDFKGITMGASAGAMVLVKEFVMDWEQKSYHKGLGYIPYNIDVIVHYKLSTPIIKMINRSYRERKDVKLVLLPDSECKIYVY